MIEESIPLAGVLVGLAIAFVARWFIFTGILWGMLRMQSLNYTWPGLIGTTALGSLAYFIPFPFIGPSVAFAVVYLGLKWVTQAEHTDLMFSIVIGNALMYVAAIWLLAAVLPDFQQVKAGIEARQKEETSFVPDYAGIIKNASNTFLNAAERGTTNASRAAARTNKAVAKTAVPAATVGQIKLKGITMMGTNGLAMLQAGDRISSVGVKESITLPGAQGVTRYICESISTNRVVLLLHGSQPPQRLELKLE
jgi:hypothetical protein